MKCIICHRPTTKVIATKLRKGETRKVFFCSRCELGLLDPSMSAKQLEKFYAKEYRTNKKLTSAGDPAELFKTFVQFQDSRLKLLKPYLTKRAKVLEVGCSAGMFLHHVRPLVQEIVGIDFDQVSAAYAAKKCHCPVYTTDIRETPLEESYFDVIVAFQTLEHVADPHEFIGTLARYLRPGGVMMIEIPNLYDALAHVYDLPNHYTFYYHAAHLWYFTAKSLAKLMTGHGLKGQVHHTQDYNILNHLHWIDTDSPDPRSFEGLKPPRLPIRASVAPKVKKALTDCIVEADLKYKRILAEYGITSNITFLGKKGR